MASGPPPPFLQTGEESFESPGDEELSDWYNLANNRRGKMEDWFTKVVTHSANIYNISYVAML